jgi:hypothetical protein
MKLKEVLERKWGISIELLLFLIIAISTIQLNLSITIPLLIALYIISVRTRHLKWIDVGIDKTDITFKNILWGIALAGSYHIVFYYIIDPVLKPVLPPTNIQALGITKGDVRQLLVWLFISWTIAAIFEELLFRGYLINRFIDLIGSSIPAKFLIVIVTATAFGFVHSYQGIHGMISAGMVGIFQAIIFLINKRKLFIPIVIHGTFDTISFIFLFLGIS